jgi:CheY-like chemotaxis protein
MTHLRILFVEDNRLSSMISCTVLRDAGYDVVAAFDAEEAAAVIDGQSKLSALVTDINLGPGEDGFDVARRARAAYPHLPVVYVSAIAGPRVLLEGVDPNEFIAKPYHPRSVMEALDRVIPVGTAWPKKRRPAGGPARRRGVLARETRT